MIQISCRWELLLEPMVNVGVVLEWGSQGTVGETGGSGATPCRAGRARL